MLISLINERQLGHLLLRLWLYGHLKASLEPQAPDLPPANIIHVGYVLLALCFKLDVVVRLLDLLGVLQDLYLDFSAGLSDLFGHVVHLPLNVVELYLVALQLQL